MSSWAVVVYFIGYYDELLGRWEFREQKFHLWINFRWMGETRNNFTQKFYVE